MYRTITVEKLKGILEQLEPDMLLHVNQVSNLAVLAADAEYIGYIDFSGGYLDIMFSDGVCEDSGQFCEVCTCGGPRCNT